MRRELKSVRTEEVLGSVVATGDWRDFTGTAGNVLSALRRRLGDDKAVDLVMDEGWSNGYLYFGDPKP